MYTRTCTRARAGPPLRLREGVFARGRERNIYATKMSELTRELLSRLPSYLISWDLPCVYIYIYEREASAARNGYVKAPFADRN